MIKVVLEARKLSLGYGVTANIAASHRYRISEIQPAGHFTSSVSGRGSSGFDSPYPNTFFQVLSCGHSTLQYTTILNAQKVIF
jgi:hypothetical protein